MSKLFHRFATGYKAGIDIRKLVKKETERGSPAFRQKMGRVLESIDRGESLAASMHTTGGYFPPLPLAIVEAGERGGRLEDAFARLSKHYDNLVRFRNKFLQSIAWPTFELVFAIFIIGLMILLLGWLTDHGDNFFGTGMTSSSVFAIYFAIIMFIFGSLFVLIFGTAKGWFGLLPMRIARRLPLIGSTIEALALSRFAWAMSITENAGMNPKDMARLGLRSTENYFYTRLEDEVCDGLQDGHSFYEVFKDTEAFPSDLLIHVDNGEMAGELAESMERASQEMGSKAESNLKLIGTIGFICMLLFVGLIIGGAIIYLYNELYIQPINDLLNDL